MTLSYLDNKNHSIKKTERPTSNLLNPLISKKLKICNLTTSMLNYPKVFYLKNSIISKLHNMTQNSILSRREYLSHWHLSISVFLVKMKMESLILKKSKI